MDPTPVSETAFPLSTRATVYDGRVACEERSIGLSGDNYDNMMTVGRVPRCGEVLGFAQISSRGESEEPARQEVRASF